MTHEADGRTTIPPETMTALLRRAGALPDGLDVVSVTSEPVVGGYLSRMDRLRLGYASVGSPATRAVDLPPRTVVLKRPAEEELPRTVGAAMGMYHREVLFYRQLASRTGVRTPQCYHAETAEPSGDFTLLLEDIADADVHSQDEACSDGELLLALDQAARLHASHWNDTALAAAEWLIQLTAPGVRTWHSLYQDAWQQCLSWPGVEWPRRLTEMGDALATASVDTWIGGYDGPWTLTHADFHLSNLLYRRPPSGAPGREVVVVDWQLVTHASPLIDVAFLLGRMPTEHRREVEEPLLKAYHRMLGDQGVTDYTWAACRRDYARWLWFGVLNAAIASTAYPITPDELPRHVVKIERFLTQAYDHDSLRYLR